VPLRRQVKRFTLIEQELRKATAEVAKVKGCLPRWSNTRPAFSSRRAQSAQAVKLPAPVFELFEQYAVTGRVTNIVDDATTAIRQRSSTNRPTLIVEMKDPTGISEQVETTAAIEADTHWRTHFPDQLRRSPGKQREILKAGTNSAKIFLVVLPWQNGYNL
jgi:hypothetical protein